MLFRGPLFRDKDLHQPGHKQVRNEIHHSDAKTLDAEVSISKHHSCFTSKKQDQCMSEPSPSITVLKSACNEIELAFDLSYSEAYEKFHEENESGQPKNEEKLKTDEIDMAVVGGRAHTSSPKQKGLVFAQSPTNTASHFGGNMNIEEQNKPESSPYTTANNSPCGSVDLDTDSERVRALDAKNGEMRYKKV